MVLATGVLHRRWVCACSELTRALSFAIGVRSQGSFYAEETWHRTKNSKVTVTEEPTPEVEEQPEEGVEEEEPEDDDKPIDEIDIRAQNAVDLLIENLATGFAVDVQDQQPGMSLRRRRSSPREVDMYGLAYS